MKFKYGDRVVVKNLEFFERCEGTVIQLTEYAQHGEKFTNYLVRLSWTDNLFSEHNLELS